MLENLKANILFHSLLKRKDIRKAYAMVGPEDSWYDTITKVHNSLAEIQKMPHRELSIISHDGLRLEAKFYPCQTQSRATVIWIHGYTSHAERESAFPGLFYLSQNCNVLIPYLRAHGPSEGKYLTFGALECKDIMGWIDWANREAPDGRIILHGLSMGGGIALHLCNKDLKNVVGIVADAPTVSIPEVFRSVAKSVFKGEADGVCTRLFQKFKNEFHVDALEFDALREVSACRYPLFLTAGSEEHMDEMLHKLAALAPVSASVLILPGCNHGNGMYKQTERYQSALCQFLADHAPSV